TVCRLRHLTISAHAPVFCEIVFPFCAKETTL
ncbi:MAG: hypothetical protein ACI9ND_001079, partial [Yoonia sp.]